MKRFFLEFDFAPAPNLPETEERLYGGTFDYSKQEYSKVHVGGYEGNTIRAMKNYISRIKKSYPTQKPHNFRIFDRQAPDEPCGHVGEVYFQSE